MEGTSLTEMKREMLSIIPRRAQPKLRRSAGRISPGVGQLSDQGVTMERDLVA